MLWILFLIAAFVSLIALAWHRTGYWQRRGLPGPPSKLFVGAIDRLYDPKHPNLYRLHEWTKEYGPVYGYQRGWLNALVISDPDAAKEVMSDKFEYFHKRDTAPILGDVDTEKRVHLVMASGKRWKRLRALSTPAFSTANLKKILPTLDYCATETVHWLEKATSEGGEIDATPFFFEFTMDTIARLCLGQHDNQQHVDSNVPLLMDAFERLFGNWSKFSWMVPPLGGHLKRLSELIGFLANGPCIRIFTNVQAVIDERKAKRARGEPPSDTPDFIDMFLDVEIDEHGIQSEVTANVYDKTSTQVQKRLTTEEIVMQCFVFLLAGLDTTANALALTVFYLAKHPHIQERLWREIEEVCTAPTPTFEELCRLKYAEALMKEVLRHNPIGQLVVSRRCAATTTIGDLTIEKDTDVVLDLLAIHFDKKAWGEDAEEFRPERFLAEKIPMHAYYAFGGGPRLCVGIRLAYLEEKLLLVHLLRKFRILPTEQMGNKPKLLGNTVLTPGKVMIRLEERV